MTSIQASSTTNNTTTRLLSGILHGVMRGAWIGAILLSLAEAYRPGFLALGEAAGWTAIFVILTLFCILGGLGGWVVLVAPRLRVQALPSLSGGWMGTGAPPPTGEPCRAPGAAASPP